MLRIAYEISLVPEGGTQVYCSLSEFAQSTNKDAAGHAFHHRCLLLAGIIDYAPAPRAEDSSGNAEDNDDQASADQVHGDDKAAEGVQWKHKKENRKDKKKGKKKDLYKLLGMEDLRWMATDSQLKKGYQKMALKHHPDKACAGIEDEAQKAKLEEKFKAIQDAFETLSNPSKRREYDSVDVFDDSLPESCRAEDFITVFGAAFRRQSRWSERKPVPDLGGPDADFKAVSAFYDFWYGFKSWREFPHEDEEDPECAECREHKRWIERENTRLRAKSKKEETKRLRDFVDRAYAADPRVLAQKAAVKAERERKKQEKAEAAQAKADAEAEAKRVAAEAAAAEAKASSEAASAARKQKQIDQRELRRQRKRLRDLCGDAVDGDDALVSSDDVEDLCKELSRAQIETLCSGLEGAADEDGKAAVVGTAMEAMYGNRGEDALRKQQAKAKVAAEARAVRKAALKERVERAREWDAEEVRMLDKALQKFPVGVPRRWEQVAAYVRTRTQDEILFMVKVKQGAHASKVQPQDWRAGRKGGVNADVSIDSAADDRTFAFTDVKLNGAAAVPPTAPPAPVPAAANGGAATNGAAAAAAPAANGAAAWSKEQELALIKAIKAIGKEVPERWSRIAEQVEGKAMLDCRKRFQDMKAKARPAAAST